MSLESSSEPISSEPISSAHISSAPISSAPISSEPISSAPICSAKGCREDATTDLQWRNPRLHAAARRKHWLACDEHADHLAAFLDRRGFLLARGPLVL